MRLILLILVVIVAFGLIGSVLLQSGRSAGLSGAISGGAEALLGKKRGVDELLSRITVVLAACFFLLAILLTVIGG